MLDAKPDTTDHTAKPIPKSKQHLSSPFIGTSEDLTSYSDILNSQSSLNMIMDKKGKLLFFSHACEQLSGYLSVEVAGKSIYELLVPSEEKFRVESQLTKLWEEKFPLEFESEWITRQGERKRIAWSNSVVLNERKEPLFIISSGVNVTEYATVVKVLRQREDQLQMALEGANQAIWDWNYINGIATNLHWAEMLGYEPIELTLEFPDWHVLIHPDDIDLMQSSLKDHIDGKTNIYRCEYRVKKKNGDWIWVLSQGRVVEHDHDGKAARIVGTRTDITARKQAELNLQTSEIRFRTLFDSANDAILILSDDIFTDCNNIALEFFGCEREELLGNTPYHFSPPTQPDGSLSEQKALWWIALALSGEKQVFEWVHRRKDGTDFNCEISLSPVTIGRQIFIQVIIRDITERKRIEEDLQDSETRFRSLFDDSPVALLEIDTSELTPLLEKVVDWHDEHLLAAIDTEMIAMMLGTLKIVDANKAAVKMYGVPDKETITDSPAYSMIPELRHTFVNMLIAMATGERQIAEESILRVAWRPDPIEVLFTVSFNESSRMIIAMQEISDRKRAEKQLIASETKFSEAFRHNPDLMVISTVEEERFVEINDAFEKITGYSRTEVIGKTAKELGLLTDDSDEPQFLNARLPDGKTASFELKLKARSGEQRLLRATVAPMTLNDRPHLLSILRDITDQMKVMETIREAQNRFEMVIEHNPLIAIQGFDRDGTILHWNHASENLYGYFYDEAVGKKLPNLIINDIDSRSLFFDDVEQIWTTGKALPASERLTNSASGDPHWVFSSMFPIQDEGQVVEIFSLDIDITEKKNARMALEEEKERLAVTLRSIGDAVITTDRDGKVTLLNKAAEKMTGWKSDEAIGQSLTEVFNVVDETTRKPMSNPVVTVLKTKSIVSLSNHTVLIALDGQERVIADSGAPIFDAHSEIIGVVLVFRDITMEHHVQAEIQRSAKLESLSVLAGGIAHDFNNLLTGIIGSLSFIRMFPDAQDETMSLIGEAEKSAFRAKDLTQQLLTFAKGGTPVRKVTAINDIIRETVMFSLRGSKSNGHFELPDDLWPVEVDSGQISQVFQNLSINAVQAMPHGGKITVHAENVSRATHRIPRFLEKERYVRIEFNDSGTGIAPENLQKVFDPYFTTKSDGSGLGLATTYSIIKYHNGIIEVSSQLGIGTTFTIYLPAKEEAFTTDVSSDTNGNGMKGTGRILVLDDDDIVRSLLTRVLEHLGYEAVMTEEGNQTIEEYKKASESGNPFDVVILDLTIPGGLGGLEAFEALRQFDPKVKAIVSSGYATDPVMSHYKDYGFVAVAVKPYKIGEMSDLIQQALASS